MSQEIIAQPLTATAFAPFGDILEAKGTADKIINQGLCGRFHDLARLDFSDGRAGISLFDATLTSFYPDEHEPLSNYRGSGQKQPPWTTPCLPVRSGSSD